MSVKYIAFYLPQFYPFPENDRWWGEGFTDWTNVVKARPIFPGHYQPHMPADLVYYDLRERTVQREQVAFAKQFGVDAFCFHYYWFAGKRLLDVPLDAFLTDTDLDFPFCLCWANESWTRRWDGAEHDVLIAQTHSAENDIHFIDSLLPFVRDPRYLRVDGRPILIVYRPQQMPDAKASAERWRKRCRTAGVGEIHLVSALTHGNFDWRQFGYDAGVEFPPHNVTVRARNAALAVGAEFVGRLVEYGDVARASLQRDYEGNRVYRCVCPSWDNSARTGNRALVVLSGTPSNYERWLGTATELTVQERGVNDQLLFINAWNEWAEGCHLEPDQKYGFAFLEATRRVKSGQSMVDDLYETTISDPSGSVYDSNPVSPLAALKLKVGGRLLRLPVTLKAMQLAFRGARAAFLKVSNFSARLPRSISKATSNHFERPLNILPIKQTARIVSTRAELLSADDDAIWTMLPRTRVARSATPRIHASNGTRNKDRLAAALAERDYISASFDFARYRGCIAHPRSVGAVTRDGYVPEETITTYAQIDKSFRSLNYLNTDSGRLELTQQPIRRIAENVLLAFSSSSPAFGHFMFDSVPQLLGFEDEIKQGRLKIVIPVGYPQWMRSLLTTWGFRRRHFLVLPYEAFEFRFAIVGSALDGSGTFYPNPQAIELCRSVEHRFFSNDLRQGPRKIYLMRGAGTMSSREIANEKEIISVLSDRDFTIVEPQKLALQAQINLFRGAKLIVAPHGSAFANLIWCKEGSQIIDLMPDDWVGVRGDSTRDVWASRLSAVCNLRYSVLLCPSKLRSRDITGKPAIDSKVVLSDLLDLVSTENARQ